MAMAAFGAALGAHAQGFPNTDPLSQKIAMRCIRDPQNCGDAYISVGGIAVKYKPTPSLAPAASATRLGLQTAYPLKPAKAIKVNSILRKARPQLDAAAQTRALKT